MDEESFGGGVVSFSVNTDGSCWLVLGRFWGMPGGVDTVTVVAVVGRKESLS